MGLFDGIAGFFGGGIPPAYQTPQKIQDFMQPIPVSAMQTASLYQNLLGAKQGYNDAQKSMDLIQEALQTPDLGEDMRNNWQRKFNEYKQARDAAAQTADSLRNTAATIGVDVSDYGNDKTLQESAQAFQNHKNMAFKNFLNLPTLDELEENRYRELRSRGASPRAAESIVSEERGKFKRQIAQRLNDFMGTYGKNPDGSLDQDIGIAAIGSVLQDPQQVAQLFVSSFATPGKVYDANQNLATQLATIDAQNRGAWDRAKLSSDTNILTSREGQAGQNWRLGETLKAQEREGEANREMQLRIAGMKATMSLYGSRGGGDGDKLNEEVNALARQLGYSDDLPDEEKQKIMTTARLTVLEHKYGIGNKKLRDVGYLKETMDVLGIPKDEQDIILKKSLGYEEPKPTKKDEALDDAGNYFRNTFDKIQEATLAGDKAKAKALLNDLKGDLYSKEYRELLDKESFTKADRKVNVYTKWLNGDYESDEGKTNYVKDRFLAEYGREPTSDDIQSAFMNENFFGMPTRRKKVETPKWNFNVAPMSQGSMYNSGQAYSNPASPNVPNSVYIPYGQPAYFPNR